MPAGELTLEPDRATEMVYLPFRAPFSCFSKKW